MAYTSALPSSRQGALTAGLPRRIAFGLAATLVVAVAAHIAFPLPFTPVPLTLQPLAVLGVGLALGPVDGFFAMLAYLAEGAAGLPVFSPYPGLGGLAQLFGPTGGFLLAYPAVAFVAGGLRRHVQGHLGSFSAALVGCSTATLLLFMAGACWLAHFAHFSAHAVWIAAVAPFLPGEAIKVVAASGVYRALGPNHLSRSR